MNYRINEELVKKLVKKEAERMLNFKNSKYGKFIIQTNEIQYFLTSLVNLRVLFPDKNFKNGLEQSTLGKIISYFQICVRDRDEDNLVKDLKKYKTYRDKLAHKMLTDKKLTEEDCDLAITLGEKLLKKLLKKIVSEKRFFKNIIKN